MGNKVSLEENLIDLRIVSKQMSRSAQKCEKNEKAALAKLKKVCAMRCVEKLGKKEAAKKGTNKTETPAVVFVAQVYWI